MSLFICSCVKRMIGQFLGATVANLDDAIETWGSFCNPMDLQSGSQGSLRPISDPRPKQLHMIFNAMCNSEVSSDLMHGLFASATKLLHDAVDTCNALWLTIAPEVSKMTPSKSKKSKSNELSLSDPRVNRFVGLLCLLGGSDDWNIFIGDTFNLRTEGKGFCEEYVVLANNVESIFGEICDVHTLRPLQGPGPPVVIPSAVLSAVKATKQSRRGSIFFQQFVTVNLEVLTSMVLKVMKHEMGIQQPPGPSTTAQSKIIRQQFFFTYAKRMCLDIADLTIRCFGKIQHHLPTNFTSTLHPALVDDIAVWKFSSHPQLGSSLSEHFEDVDSKKIEGVAWTLQAMKNNNFVERVDKPPPMEGDDIDIPPSLLTFSWVGAIVQCRGKVHSLVDHLGQVVTAPRPLSAGPAPSQSFLGTWVAEQVRSVWSTSAPAAPSLNAKRGDIGGSDVSDVNLADSFVFCLFEHSALQEFAPLTSTRESAFNDMDGDDDVDQLRFDHALQMLSTTSATSRSDSTRNATPWIYLFNELNKAISRTALQLLAQVNTVPSKTEDIGRLYLQLQIAGVGENSFSSKKPNVSHISSKLATKLSLNIFEGSHNEQALLQICKAIFSEGFADIEDVKSFNRFVMPTSASFEGQCWEPAVRDVTVCAHGKVTLGTRVKCKRDKYTIAAGSISRCGDGSFDVKFDNDGQLEANVVPSRVCVPVVIKDVSSIFGLHLRAGARVLVQIKNSSLHNDSVLSSVSTLTSNSIGSCEREWPTSPSTAPPGDPSDERVAIVTRVRPSAAAAVGEKVHCTEIDIVLELDGTRLDNVNASQITHIFMPPNLESCVREENFEYFDAAGTSNGDGQTAHNGVYNEATAMSLAEEIFSDPQNRNKVCMYCSDDDTFLVRDISVASSRRSKNNSATFKIRPADPLVKESPQLHQSGQRGTKTFPSEGE